MAPMEDKKDVFKFAARCRDQDRQYEINNNAELDNGVYHKFVYSSKDDSNGDQPKNKQAHGGDGRDQLLSRNSSMHQGANRGEYTSGVDLNSSGEDLTKAKRKKSKGLSIEAEREALKADIRKLKKGDGSRPHQESDYYLPDMISEEIDEERVRILENFGYPREYIH